jgi:hypothetical protein
VPEQGDASIEAQLNKSEEELDAFTFARNAEISNGMMELFRMGIGAGRFLDEHPEINPGAQAAPSVPSEPREDAEPRERRVHSEAEKDEAMLAQGKAANAAHLDDVARWKQMGDGDVARGERSERTCETHRVSQEGPVHCEPASSSKPSSVNSADDSSRASPSDDTGGGARATSSDNSAGDSSRASSSDGMGVDAHATLRDGDVPATYRAFRVPENECASAYARCLGLVRLAERIGPRLAKMNLDQNVLGKKMINQGRKKNVKEAFLENRAVAILKNSLLHCDELFRDLGFGGWMPFRYADQWLAFTSLMRKLLAANGLITPKGPNHWRDFIENTPEVVEDKLRLPKSLGPTKKYAAVESIEEVTKQAKEAANKDPAARKRFDQRFAMGP